jgi:hypothetical protein
MGIWVDLTRPCDACGNPIHGGFKHCKKCDIWFCKRHLKPKFPFIIDWDTIFNVQTNPEIKLRYHMEYRLEEGHPDLVYWRRTVEAFEIEEKKRNELIKQAMDRMMHSEKYSGRLPVDTIADRNRRVAMLLKEEIELTEKTPTTISTAIPVIKRDTTVTYENVYNYHFSIPVEVYSNMEYRKRLNNARTMAEVEQIIKDYNEH